MCATEQETEGYDKAIFSVNQYYEPRTMFNVAHDEVGRCEMRAQEFGFPPGFSAGRDYLPHDFRDPLPLKKPGAWARRVKGRG